MAATRRLLPLLALPLLATCQTPPMARVVGAGVPFIDPLPIPEAPPPRLPRDRSEPAAIALLPDDEALAGAICRDGGRLLPPTGTLFGHRRFDEPVGAALVPPPARLAGGNCQAIHADMAAALTMMLDAADAEDAAVGLAISAVSCHRPVERQAALFCADGRLAARGYAGQARWIAPPGYSEHATGLSIDFGSRTEEQCNLRPCFADTRVGRWLARNAPRFGFELSFPPDNRQGVAHEPWHYRYVGTAAARGVFGSADSASR